MSNNDINFLGYLKLYRNDQNMQFRVAHFPQDGATLDQE